MSKRFITFTFLFIFILSFQVAQAGPWRNVSPSECYKARLTPREDFFKKLHKTTSPCKIVEAADQAIEKLKDAEGICIDAIRNDPRIYNFTTGVEEPYRLIMQHRRRAAEKCKYASPAPAWKPMRSNELDKMLRKEGVLK